ncbi:hypothetical protein GCM10010430_13250 [Kitasatospora cystarginea]|uniref:DUF5753 domain-containing protein n=1 Tax=Kitasatospora cystarginea TaxID=58350 RepID=A0ABN3DJW2_9ACTN
MSKRQEHVASPRLPEYVAQEARAVELRVFELGIVHGLLQTPEYAAAITAGAVRRGSITQARRGRSRVRTGPSPGVRDGQCRVPA